MLALSRLPVAPTIACCEMGHRPGFVPSHRPNLFATAGLTPLVLCLAAGCGTSGAGGSGTSGGTLSSGRTSGYEVREARTDRDGDDTGPLAMRAEEGSLDQEDAQEAIGRHFRKLVRCYDQAGAARDYAGGPVTLRFVVDLDGRALGVHVLQSSLGSFEVERCLTTTALQIRFPRPHGNGRAQVEYSLEFRSTGEVPVVDLPADAATAALPALLTRVGADCHDLGVDEVTATVYVDRRGAVRSLGFSSQAPFPEASAACVAQAVRATPIPVQIHGEAMGRALIALRNQDVRDPPPLAQPGKRASGKGLVQGRRTRSRRR